MEFCSCSENMFISVYMREALVCIRYSYEKSAVDTCTCSDTYFFFSTLHSELQGHVYQVASTRSSPSGHAAVKKLFFYRFCMGRTSIVFRSKAIVWGVSLLCF